VIISPTDRDLISEGSSVRRKFLDRTISQSNKSYLQNLLAYQRTLNQRNALLKHFASSNQFDKDTLSVFNEKLVQFGQPIYQARKKFVEAFQPLFQDRYQFISGGKEVVSIGYESKIGDNNFEILLEESLQKDRILQHTSIGPHKDDLGFQINDFPIKKFGSQGQQKTFLIALKLAQFDVIRDQMNVLPILLLDDIFDKLDDYRVMQIINLVNDDSFGQLFVTDTNKERTENIIKQTAQSYSMFSL
jgi:DNA replication and repair protein RecF